MGITKDQLQRAPRISIYAAVEILVWLAMFTWRTDEELSMLLKTEPGSTKFYQLVTDLKIYGLMTGRPDQRKLTERGSRLATKLEMEDLKDAVLTPELHRELIKSLAINPQCDWRALLLRKGDGPKGDATADTFLVSCQLLDILRPGPKFDHDSLISTAAQLIGSGAKLARGLRIPTGPVASRQESFSVSSRPARMPILRSDRLSISLYESPLSTDRPKETLELMLLDCPESTTPGHLCGWGLEIQFERELSLSEASTACRWLESWINARVGALNNEKYGVAR
jgi:hypothetical protein